VDRSHGAFEAFDGVLIHLVDGRTLRAAPFTVEEAMRWYRLRASVQQGGGMPDGPELLNGLPARLGLEDERLEDVRLVQVGARAALALDVEEPWSQLTFGDLTFGEAVKLAQLYVTATADPHAPESSRAKVQVLASFKSSLGLATPTAAEVFHCARAFTQAIYHHIYGLASDFSDSPVLSPRGGVRARAASISIQVSTT
jgi:hypothetical protein